MARITRTSATRASTTRAIALLLMGRGDAGSIQRIPSAKEQIMRTTSTASILAIALLGLFAATASAQDTLRAKVPFAFTVRGKTLPAGTYEIRNDQGLIYIIGRTAHGGVVALSHPANGRDPAGTDPVLVFV